MLQKVETVTKCNVKSVFDIEKKVEEQINPYQEYKVMQLDIPESKKLQEDWIMNEL